MRRRTELEDRLLEWAREYQGGRYENVGWNSTNPIHRMMIFEGAPPRVDSTRGMPISTAGDDVERAVAALAMQPDGYRPASVLRIEYFRSADALPQKIQSLRRMGLPMGRTEYFASLKLARVHVAGWLRIRFCESEAGEEAA